MYLKALMLTGPGKPLKVTHTHTLSRSGKKENHMAVDESVFFCMAIGFALHMGDGFRGVAWGPLTYF